MTCHWSEPGNYPMELCGAVADMARADECVPGRVKCGEKGCARAQVVVVGPRGAPDIIGSTILSQKLCLSPA